MYEDIDIPEETGTPIGTAVRLEVKIRKLQEELAWAQRDQKAALLKIDPADAEEYVSALSNALAPRSFTD